MVLSLDVSHIMIGQQTDVVAGDINGTAWRCSTRDTISTLDESFCRLCVANAAGPKTTVGTRFDSEQCG